MTDRTCGISKSNARIFVARASVAELTAWYHCGCTGCTFCDEVVIARDERLAPPPPVDRAAQTTTDGRSVDEVRAEQAADGNRMHKSYIVLTDAERAKGFVRPVRLSYVHVGAPAPSLRKGCGAVTTMSPRIAETYARAPDFYGSTMCVQCGTHYPVGENGEFVWNGTDERVGT